MRQDSPCETRLLLKKKNIDETGQLLKVVYETGQLLKDVDETGQLLKGADERLC